LYSIFFNGKVGVVMATWRKSNRMLMIRSCSLSLPYQAQLSSINDLLIKDYNKDGIKDMLIVGNLFTD